MLKVVTQYSYWFQQQKITQLFTAKHLSYVTHFSSVPTPAINNELSLSRSGLRGEQHPCSERDLGKALILQFSQASRTRESSHSQSLRMFPCEAKMLSKTTDIFLTALRNKIITRIFRRGQNLAAQLPREMRASSAITQACESNKNCAATCNQLHKRQSYVGLKKLTGSTEKTKGTMKMVTMVIITKVMNMNVSLQENLDHHLLQKIKC